MENEFTTYEQALALKELGFDESFNPFNTFYYRNGNLCEANKDAVEYFNSFNDEVILAPLYQQAFRWFREKHGLIGLPRRDPSRNYNGWWFEIFEQKIKSDNPISLDDSDYINFDTYEEAELECLKQLIKVVKEKT
jgi:hypothetical protein